MVNARGMSLTSTCGSWKGFSILPLVLGEGRGRGTSGRLCPGRPKGKGVRGFLSEGIGGGGGGTNDVGRWSKGGGFRKSLAVEELPSSLGKLPPSLETRSLASLF